MYVCVYVYIYIYIYMNYRVGSAPVGEEHRHVDRHEQHHEVVVQVGLRLHVVHFIARLVLREQWKDTGGGQRAVLYTQKYIYMIYMYI